MNKLVKITIEVTDTLYDNPDHLFPEYLTKDEMSIALINGKEIKYAIHNLVNDKLGKLHGCTELPKNTKFNVIIK